MAADIKFPPTETGVVRVMTFNIRVGDAWWLDGPNRWSKRRHVVIDRLVNSAADVIGFQEALGFQVDQIQRALPQYSTYAVGSSNGKKKGPTCAILYRKDRLELVDSGTFWFSNTPEKPGSRYWGSFWPRLCSWVQLLDKADQTHFYVYNLHLSCFSQRSREKSVRLLAKRIAARNAKAPFIVMGDFNMELDNPAMKYLHEIGYQTPCSRMVDAHRSVFPDEANVGTYHGFGGRTSGPKIDHISVSEHTQALDVNIDRHALNGRYPSDHFPVIATIRVLSEDSVVARRFSPNL